MLPHGGSAAQRVAGEAKIPKCGTGRNNDEREAFTGLLVAKTNVKPNKNLNLLLSRSVFGVDLSTAASRTGSVRNSCGSCSFDSSMYPPGFRQGNSTPHEQVARP